VSTHCPSAPEPSCRSNRLGHTPRWRGRLLREDGFTLIEVLVAAVVLTTGILGLIGAFNSARNLTLSSERRTSIAHRAQQEIERLQTVPYAELAMTSTPLHSTETSNPDYYVNGTKYQWDPQVASTEELVSATSTPAACESTPQEGCGVVSGARTAWSDGVLSGYVYDFVTWHGDGHCGALCPAEKNYKRVTVVVTVAVPVGKHAVAPARVSAFIPDPKASAST
jgi:prepilin-type N-terminal cleavage/methylation domain-containing protein